MPGYDRGSFKGSLRSGWVEKEYSHAINHQANYQGFRVIPIRLEECEVPGFLGEYRWIDVPDGLIDLRSATELIDALYFNDRDPSIQDALDIYVSRTWRLPKAPPADFVCKSLAKSSFRSSVKPLTSITGTKREFDQLFPAAVAW